MRSFVVLFLVLAAGVLFFAVRQPAVKGKPVQSAEAISEVKPGFMRAAASGVSEKVSSFTSAPAFPGRKIGDASKEKVLLVSDNEYVRSRAAGAAHEEDGAPAGVSAAPLPTPSLAFDGIKNRQNGENFGLFFLPSDTNGDAGQSHYVQATNSLVQIFNKSGGAVAPPFKMSDIFAPLGTACSTRNDGEPIVLYDTLADRWLLSSFCTAFPPFRQMIAISKTGDPTGAYFIYEFVMPSNRLNDYAKFGVWPDGYYMSADEFIGSDYAGTAALAFDRQKMLAGDPAAGFIYFNFPSTSIIRTGGILPSDLDGYTPPPAGAPNIFTGYTSNDYGDPLDAMRLFEFHADFQQPANSTFTERAESPLEVAVFDPTSPPGRSDIPQPSPGEMLDSQSDRLMYRVAYRNFGTHESLVFNHTVRLTPLDQAYRAGVRVYELRRPVGGTFPFPNVQTTISDATESRWMGAAAQDHQGNIAVEYSVSSAAKAPSAVYTGRLASDPPGTFRPEETFAAGTGVQTAFGFRWGNYTGMTVDPVDDCTFWMTNQYYTAESQAESPFSWLTRIAKFKFDECTAAPRGTFIGTVRNSQTSQAIAGARVTASAYSRHTDVAGNYGPMFVVPGTYALTASAKGYLSQTFTVSVADGSGLVEHFLLQPIPEIEPAGTSIAAESCAPNNALDPGETVTLNVTFRNTGAAAAQDLTAALLNFGGVTGAGPAQNFGALPVNGAGVTRPFTFRVAPAIGCGGEVTLLFSVQDAGAPLGTVSIKLQSGTPKIALSENFDRATRPSLPAGWTTSATGAQQIWTTSAARFESQPHSLFSPDPNQVGVNEVVTPTFALTSPNARLKFRNWYELETTFLRNKLYDGSVLEIKIGAGAWQDILAAGGTFESGGYDGILESCCQNPLMGRLAWSGRSGINQLPEFITTSAKLPPAAAGQNVNLRWRVGTDVGTFKEGQYIDDVVVTDGNSCACGSAVPVRAPFDFDGDGKTDLSVFHPTDAPGAPDFSVRNSSNGAVQNTSWGSVGDRAANADFDGDGKTDLAVFRPSEGNWYALRSSDLAVIALHFGLAEDKAVPADFDGDGKADITVFRPSEGNWYSLRSSNGQFFAVHFGLSGDAPVQADYDGDGKADIAVFRPSEGNWYYLRSSDGQFFGQHFGLSGDRPVAGDYDGDGKADLAVFRPSDRNWYLLRSDQGFTAVNFGLGSDLPLQADLDGDGVRDIAVFRPAENNWYYLKSSDGGFEAGNFGSSGDTPVPSIYVGP